MPFQNVPSSKKQAIIDAFERQADYVEAGRLSDVTPPLLEVCDNKEIQIACFFSELRIPMHYLVCHTMISNPAWC